MYCTVLLWYSVLQCTVYTALLWYCTAMILYYYNTVDRTVLLWYSVLTMVQCAHCTIVLVVLYCTVLQHAVLYRYIHQYCTGSMKESRCLLLVPMESLPLRRRLKVPPQCTGTVHRPLISLLLTLRFHLAVRRVHQQNSSNVQYQLVRVS